MIKNNKFNFFIYFFFISYLIIGFKILPDYPVTTDEPLHRINGFISLKFISDLFLLNLDLDKYAQNIPYLFEDWRKTYGTVFDLPMSFLEYFFDINDITNVFLLRHYFTFIIFYISCIFFFKIIKNSFDNSLYGIFAVIFLITSPRIFSHSFYNSKDIVFLSFFLIAIFYSLELLKKFNYRYLFFSCFFSALATNIRIVGIYLPILIIFFYYFNYKKFKLISNFKFTLVYILFFFSIYYFFFPYLWLNPFENFFFALKEGMNYPAWWDYKVLYFGKYINPENLPWHYFFFWFFSTTPLVFILGILLGIFVFLKNYLKFFIKIDLNKDFYLWKNYNELILLFFFLLIFIPLFIIITLNSTMYSGWRHLYFLYPFFIFFSFYLLKYFEMNKIYYYSYFLLVTFQIIFNSLFIYVSHPIQNIYFNFLGKKIVSKYSFPIDYWGVANQKTIINLLKNTKGDLNISSSSYTNLNNLNLSYKISLTKNRNYFFSGTSSESKINSNYLFTNYYFHANPKNIEKYTIPNKFTSFYKLVIDDIVVNEVFIKK